MAFVPATAASVTARQANVTARQANASCPWVGSSAPISQRVAQLMSQMTLADEVTLVTGDGLGTNSQAPYNYYMPGIPSLCIPALGMADGPAGVADGMLGVTGLPAPIALAATWSGQLANQFGTVAGSELYGKGAGVDLGPMVNIARDPRFGRTFETFGEDPLLNGTIGTSEIQGIQSQGVIAMVKHLAAYNQETYRNTPADDVTVDPRVLEEIYLPAFKAAVEQGDAGAVMCSYSTINGSQACDDSDLLQGELKQRMDFPGFVVSDDGALQTTDAASAGTDMEQPENTYFASLAAAVQDGTVSQATLNTMVERILTEMFRFDLIDAPPAGNPSDVVTSSAHASVALQVAEQSATLLKNAGAALPLAASGAGTIAVIGPAASAAPVYGGGGSSFVDATSADTVTSFDGIAPLKGIQSAAGPGTKVVYSQGLPTDGSLSAIPSSALSPAYTGTSAAQTYTASLTAPETGTYVIGVRDQPNQFAPTYLSLDGQVLIDNPGTPGTADTPLRPIDTAAVQLQAGDSYLLTVTGTSTQLVWATPSVIEPYIQKAVTAAQSAAAAVVVVSDDSESEGGDRASLTLPSAQDQLVAAVAAANPRTVVVLDAGAPITMPWLSQVAAVLDAWYPGQANGTALASILFGQTDPSGHLPISFPASVSQTPAATAAQFPGSNGTVQYSEGLAVGYRWYDSQPDATPLFPFGFGLSYTSFSYSDLQVTPSSNDGTGDVTVSATVTNTGPVAGTDVAQVYLGDPPAAGEPPEQLAGFQPVSLAPAASQQIQFTITPSQLRWWNDATKGWDRSAGTYDVYLGDSSGPVADFPLHGSFALAASPGPRQVTITAPSTMHAGTPATVSVALSSRGDATLGSVRLALQLPDGWTANPVGSSQFSAVAPGEEPTTSFTVTPPSYALNTNETIHATATLGADDTLEAGVPVTVTLADASGGGGGTGDAGGTGSGDGSGTGTRSARGPVGVGGGGGGTDPGGTSPGATSPGTPAPGGSGSPAAATSGTAGTGATPATSPSTSSGQTFAGTASKLVVGRIRIRQGVVTVPLRCEGDKGTSCSAELTMAAPNPQRRSTRSNLVLARIRLKLPAGRRKNVGMPLGHAGRSLLARQDPLSATLTVSQIRAGKWRLVTRKRVKLSLQVAGTGRRSAKAG